MKKTLLLLITLTLAAISANAVSPKKLNIVFIGNSITQGVLLPDAKTDAPPVKTVEYLKVQKDISDVKYYNIGVSGSTTLDWLPNTGRLFPSAIQAADNLVKNEGILLFSVMIGTNDSAEFGCNGSPVSADDYYKNLKTILDTLLTHYPQAKVLLNRPIWYSPNTYNGSKYMQEGLDRLATYTPKLRAITEEYKGKVFMGDQNGYEFFHKNHKKYHVPEQGNAGTFYLHPNKEGATELGRIWGETIVRNVKKW